MNGFDWSVIVFVILLLPAAGLYVLPALIAFMRHKKNFPMILAVNVFAGWTLVGWGIALALALGQGRNAPR